MVPVSLMTVVAGTAARRGGGGGRYEDNKTAGWCGKVRWRNKNEKGRESERGMLKHDGKSVCKGGSVCV